MHGSVTDGGPLVWAIARSARTLAFALPPSLLLLLVDVDDANRLWIVIGHLLVVVLVGFGLTTVLARRVDEPWYPFTGTGERWATAATATVLVTGVVALVTLASSAALGYQPSLQFLQLLSAIDIAWVVGATTIGVGWLAGRRAGLAAGSMLVVVCVWSIWRYLDVVGFTDDGGWLVDGAALARLVLPYDVMAAIIALGSVWFGARRDAARSTAPAAESAAPD